MAPGSIPEWDVGAPADPFFIPGVLEPCRHQLMPQREASAPDISPCSPGSPECVPSPWSPAFLRQTCSYTRAFRRGWAQMTCWCPASRPCPQPRSRVSLSPLQGARLVGASRQGVGGPGDRSPLRGQRGVSTAAVRLCWSHCLQRRVPHRPSLAALIGQHIRLTLSPPTTHTDPPLARGDLR